MTPLPPRGATADGPYAWPTTKSAGVVEREAHDALGALRIPEYSGLRQRRAENPGMDTVWNLKVIFDLAVNAYLVDRRASDTGEIDRRPGHAGKGRVRAKEACRGLAGAPHDATELAISNHTEPVVGESTRTGLLVSKGDIVPPAGTIRIEIIGLRSHGSLLR